MTPQCELAVRAVAEACIGVVIVVASACEMSIAGSMLVLLRVGARMESSKCWEEMVWSYPVASPWETMT